MAKKRRRKPTTTWGKIWHFIWYDDSLLSWVANIALAFLIIKFIVYPGLGLIFGTNLPVVAVISCSMDHRFSDCGEPVPKNLCGQIGDGPNTHETFWNACGDFYEERGISSEEFQEFPLAKGFRKGDVIVLRGVKPEQVEQGDVLVFTSNRPHPIIHRVVGVTDYGSEFVYETKGDHNAVQIVDAGLDETKVTSDTIIGKGMLRIPYAGYVKILATDGVALLLGR